MFKNQLLLRGGTTKQSRRFAAHAPNISANTDDHSGQLKRIFDWKKSDSLLPLALNLKHIIHRSPFTFRLLSFTCLLFALSFTSCTNNPNYQGKGEVFLQGEWQQDSVPAQKQLLTYSLYHLKFDCDSFFFKVSTFSKVNYGNDTCMNSGHWMEYMKGGYQLRHDTVFLDGGFCNPNFTLKGDGGCFRTGSYREFFVLTKKTDSLLHLASSTSVIPIDVRLIKKTTCTPKPL